MAKKFCKVKPQADRSMSECMRWNQMLHASATRGFELRQQGAYVVRYETPQFAHAVGFVVNSDSTCELHDKGRIYTLCHDEVRVLAKVASLSPGTVVTYQVSGKPPWDRMPCNLLLYLRASAGCTSLSSIDVEDTADALQRNSDAPICFDC